MGLSSLEALTKKINQYIEAEILIAISETNWDETAVLLIYLQHGELGSSIVPDVHVYRFEDRVPHDHSHVPSSELYTITEPLLRRLEEQHDIQPIRKT